MKLTTTLLVTCCFLLYTLGFAQTWSDVGGGTNNSPVTSMCIYNNDLYVTGQFSMAGGIGAMGIAKWDGTQWDSVGSNDTAKGISTLAVHGNSLYFAGLFDPPGAGTGDVFHLGVWDGTKWDKATGGVLGSLTQQIYSLASYNGELYAGGNFNSIGGINVNRIARWNGSNWQGLIGGVTGGFGEVRAMAVYNGELYVGGDFTNASGISANYIAKWNGTQWDSVGGCRWTCSFFGYRYNC